MQGSQPVAYTSCSMTEPEVNYAIEREVVVILFVVEEESVFEQCVYGKIV